MKPTIEEVKPTIEEVKEYFKDADEVKDWRGDKGHVEFDKIKGSDSGWIQNPGNKNWIVLWLKDKGYAKIISYKNKPIMKKEFRPIAMKCNQEQFDSIKPKLEKIGLKVAKPKGHRVYLYLTNNHLSVDGLIGMTNDNKKREIYETWNDKIFLEACGIEVEETYKITKEIILKYDMREEFPEVFEQQDDWFNDTLLSLNDLLSVWCSDNDIEMYKASPLFKSFKEVAKTKFKIV